MELCSYLKTFIYFYFFCLCSFIFLNMPMAHVYRIFFLFSDLYPKLSSRTPQLQSRRAPKNSWRTLIPYEEPCRRWRGLETWWLRQGKIAGRRLSSYYIGSKYTRNSWTNWVGADSLWSPTQIVHVVKQHLGHLMWFLYWTPQRHNCSLSLAFWVVVFRHLVYNVSFYYSNSIWLSTSIYSEAVFFKTS